MLSHNSLLKNSTSRKARKSTKNSNTISQFRFINYFISLVFNKLKMLINVNCATRFDDWILGFSRN